jgi:hypothetical protein
MICYAMGTNLLKQLFLRRRSTTLSEVSPYDILNQEIAQVRNWNRDYTKMRERPHLTFLVQQ